MTQDEVLVATVIANWKLVTGRVSSALEGSDEERLEKQVAPGRNRLLYLVGHLTALNDRMFLGLGIGERLHTELDEAYVANPDRKVADPVSAEELKKAWFEVTEKLTAAFEALTPAQWLEQHTAVSAADFAKEPLRNRLAMLLSRTNHVAMHAGQMVLAK